MPWSGWPLSLSSRGKGSRKAGTLKGIIKLEKEVKNTGLTIVPLRMFITEKGFAKLDIALAKGKKLYDKRDTIKDRDNKLNLDRIKKNFK